MRRVLVSVIVCAVLMAAVPTVYAESPGDFAGEPVKSMANAQESFLKGDMNKAAEHIHKAAVYVRTEGGKVAKGASATVKKAGDDLDRLGGEVKKGAVKSDDQLKKTFAQVDHALAKAWHTTAEQVQKSGKDSTDALKKAGQGVKLGAEDVGKFFKGIGEGIADMGQKLSS
jgi:hypothetical protein